MTQDFLTLDLGNSYLKLVRWQGSLQPSFRRVSWDADWQSAVREEFESFGGRGPVGIAISSVADEARRGSLRLLCEQLSECVLVNPEVGMEIDCESPETVGRDRLYAALGAWQLAQGPAIVVDAGTALTVDALGQRQGQPCFLGGAIAPGPVLLARSLSEGGAQLFAAEIEADVPALGRDTRRALQSGVTVGFQGAARELVERVSDEAGLQSAPVYLTGGARALLMRPGLFSGCTLIEDDWLVHRGLLACMDRS